MSRVELDPLLRTVLEGSLPSLRAALKDGILEALLDEQRAPLGDMLRRAYEVGYREALARRPVDAPVPEGGVGALERVQHCSPMPSNRGMDASEDAEFESDGSDEGDEDPRLSGSDDLNEDVDVATEEGKSDVDWSLFGNGEDQSRDPQGRASTSPRRSSALMTMPVRRTLTVGSLRDRIIKTFGLERFDIDVVVCKKGDRTRRQLKRTVQLATYELTE